MMRQFTNKELMIILSHFSEEVNNEEARILRLISKELYKKGIRTEQSLMILGVFAGKTHELNGKRIKTERHRLRQDNAEFHH